MVKPEALADEHHSSDVRTFRISVRVFRQTNRFTAKSERAGLFELNC